MYITSAAPEREDTVDNRRPRRLMTLLFAGTALTLGACTGADGTGETTVTATATVTRTVTGSPAAPTTDTATGTTETTTEATTETSTATSVATTADPAAGDCDRTAFLGEFTDPGVLFCDGSWARAGQWQTDHVLLFRFEDGQWRTHPADGRSPVTEYPCYDEQTLRSAGAPEELVDQVLLCGAAE